MPPEGVRQTGKAYVVAVTPDVCLTPMGATAVPVPYPIVGMFDNVALVATSVRMRGRPTFTTASQVTNVMGDEAGTAGGVKSSVNKSICEWITASSTVRAEGHRILRHGDQMKMNNGNTIGTVIFMPGLGPVIVGKPSEQDPADSLMKRLTENTDRGHFFKDVGIELKDIAFGWENSLISKFDDLDKAEHGHADDVLEGILKERGLPDYYAIKPYIDAARSDDPDKLGAKVIVQLALAFLTGGEGGAASAGVEADAAVAADATAADTLVDPADDAANTLVDPADDAANTLVDPPDPGTPGPGDGLTVTGAGMDFLDIMLSQFSEAMRALVKMSPTLTEQLGELFADGWKVVRGAADGGSVTVGKEIVISEGPPSGEVSLLGHEAGHGINPPPPDLPPEGRLESEYVEEYVAACMRDEGCAQLNAGKVRDEILKNSGEDIGIPGEPEYVDDYKDVYNASKNGLISNDQAVQDMGDIMRNDKVSGPENKSYQEHYGDAGTDRYNQQ
jgi:hypothetical protein